MSSRHDRRSLRIGVLALQGDFSKHIELMERLGVRAVAVRLPEQIDGLDGLIIPGGESTTVAKLMSRFGVDRAIVRCAREGMPVFGTCTGMILLASQIEGSVQPTLGLMGMTVRRNAFGRQVDSFEADLDVPELGSRPIRGVFIRAPLVTATRNNAQVLARLEGGKIVLVREGNCLAAAFHPELTDDTRVHEYFLDMVRAVRKPDKTTGKCR